jgi:hypothetical protein
MKFLDTVEKMVSGLIILKTLVFTCLHNVCKLLPINGHDTIRTKGQQILIFI